MRLHVRARYVVAVVLAAAAAVATVFTLAQGAPPDSNTKIKHLVVIFGENESFDHYFGTYPQATNPPGQPAFTAAPGTPTPDNYIQTPALKTANPNTANPQRLDRSQAVTCDQNHGYSAEQAAFNAGAMDKFVENTQGGGCTSPTLVMDYYDGNTVTTLWNLAQRFAMNDNMFANGFGPSTPGAINLVSGQTHGVTPPAAAADGTGTMTGDPQPQDNCSNPGASAAMSGANIGDRMNTALVTWGWFQGGFRPSSSPGGVAACGTAHTNVAGGGSGDYIPHHQPFQYYPSTRNVSHLPPTSVGAIGTTDQAKHQYDLLDFDAAVKAGNLPQVSFVKAAAFEDGHPGYSGPLDEQRFIARTLNMLQQSPDWDSTAVIITYDDSDGWYDHKFAGITNPSQAASDSLNGPGQCGGGAPLDTFNDRCGPGPRLPFLVISPWAKPNYVDHTFLTQASVMKFIEGNWPGVNPIGGSAFDGTANDITTMFDFTQTPNPKVFFNPTTGLVDPACATAAQFASPLNVSANTCAATPTPPDPTPPDPTPTTPTPTTPIPPTPKPPTPTPPVSFKPKLSRSAKQKGRTIAVSLKLSGLSTKNGTISVSMKLAKGKTTIASGKGKFKSSKLSLSIKAKKAFKKGSYTLTVTVKQGKKSKDFKTTLKLKQS